MGTPPVPPSSETPPPPSLPTPRLASLASQVAWSDAEAHYTSLLALFKNLMWLIGILVIVAGALAGALLSGNLRDVREDARREATRVAVEEAERGVRTSFDEKNVSALVERVAKEKVDAVTDKMVEEKVSTIADKIIDPRLGSKLQPIEQRMLLFAEVSNAESRTRLGLRPGLEEVTALAKTTLDAKVSQYARTRLSVITADYEAAVQAGLKQSGGAAMSRLLQYRPGAAPSGPLALVKIIDDDQDLNYVAIAFFAFRDLSGEKVKMFDFGAVKSWCANNQARCQ
jgi:hypothetical protein